MTTNYSKSGRAVRKMLFILITVIFVIAVLETFSYLMLYGLEKRFVSRAEIRAQQDVILDYETDVFTLTGRDTTDQPDYLRSYQVHPYTGFSLSDVVYYNTIEKWLPLLKRFQAGEAHLPPEHTLVHEYKPVQRGDFFIGITGGSVAEQFYRAGSEVLRNNLQQCDVFNGKNIQFINLSIHGFKQPQQLMMLNYFLALGGKLDLLINLDGFNEIALPISENIPKNVNPFYPRGWYFVSQGMFDRETLLAAGAMVHVLERAQALTRFCSLDPFKHSYTVSLVWKLFVTEAGKKITQIQHDLQRPLNESGHQAAFGRDWHETVHRNIGGDLEQFWQNCSLQMDAVCKMHDIHYFHFLQPNQYVPGSKTLTSVESGMGHSGVFAYLVSNSYPELIQKGEELTHLGVRFHDMTMVFRDVHETLYYDICCHFNARGNEILAESIAKIIIADYCP